MKRSLIYILIAILTIGVSATILSRLPGKETEIKVQYDFENVDEFEEYTLEKLNEKSISTILKTLRESEGSDDEVLADKVCEANSALIVEDTKVQYSIYLDNDIFYAKTATLELYAFELPNSKILQISYDISKKEYTFSVDIVDDEYLKYTDSFLQYFFAFNVEMLLMYEDNTRNVELRMKDFEVGKLKGTLGLISFEYKVSDVVDDEAVQKWEKKEKIMVMGDFKINFENEKIELTQSDFGQMLSKLNESTLNKHQLSHIVIQ